MIKINLALKKTAAMAAPGGGETASRFDLKNLRGLRFSWDDIKDIPNLRALVTLAVVSALAHFFLEDYKQGELDKLDKQIQEIQAQQDGLKKKLVDAKKFDTVKKNLEEDEKVIRTKLDTIQKLMADRGNPTRLLLAVSGSMPKDVWLQDLKVESSEIVVQGESLDFNQVSDFMRNLGESAYFKDVTLRNTQQVKDEGGNEGAKFELTLKKR